MCHGYVGNKCSVFALQTLGIEVDPLNTVQFSNNTGICEQAKKKLVIELTFKKGYPSFAGQVLSGDDVWTVFQGLLANNLANYSHLLTGMLLICYIHKI